MRLHLEMAGYEEGGANYAIENLGADRTKQACQAATRLQAAGEMTRDGMLDALAAAGFTTSEITTVINGLYGA